jgi:hypothetical protein
MSSVLAMAACAATTAISLSTTATGDYVTNGAVAGDNAGPAIEALAHGDLAGLVSHQPAIGLGSIVLRAPFAAIVSLVGGGDLLAYQLGAAACLLSLGLLAAWMIASRRNDGAQWLSGMAAASMLLVSPALRGAVASGHPEDVLAGVLATSAVIAATRGRSGWAGLMLGLAVGTKQWALIAAPSVLIAVPGRRIRTLATAGGIGAILLGSAPLADPAAFARAVHHVAGSNLVNAFSLWWPVSLPVHLSSGLLGPARVLPFGLTRSAGSLLVLSVGLLLLALGWERGRRRGSQYDVLALLALLGLVRCLSDTTNLEYYYLAVLIPLAAWETVELGRPPVVTAFATGALALMFGPGLRVDPAVLNIASIASMLILGAYLYRRAFRGAIYRSRPSTVRLQSRKQVALR